MSKYTLNDDFNNIDTFEEGFIPCNYDEEWRILEEAKKEARKEVKQECKERFSDYKFKLNKI